MRTLIFLWSIFLASCATADTNIQAPFLPPSALNQQRSELDGKRIAVTGYLVHETEAYAIWDSREAMLQRDADKCISLLYPRRLRDLVIKANRSNVKVIGIFLRDVTKDKQIYLGLCNYTGIMVSEIVS